MGSRSIGVALDPKRNSLNFLRLVLAFGVVYSHASELGFFGWRNVVFNNTSLGTISVYGFFGISGYLIAGSAMRNGVGRYLWQRFLRIFPAFWVCLVVTAFVLGAIAWAHKPLPHCDVECYLGLYHGPTSYVLTNSLLKIHQQTVASRGVGLYFTNGSLWTLFFEFLCYLLLAALSLVGLMRHRGWIAIITLGLLVALTTATLDSNFNRRFSNTDNGMAMEFMILSVIFMAGCLIYLYRERIPDSRLLALSCGVLFFASLYLPRMATYPRFG